jgi:RNA polymerase sigma-70 factor (ECF subfamily)
MDLDSLLPPLFRFAWRMTGSVADAEDIVQECFVEVLRPGTSYDAKRTPLRTYLFGVARNQALKRIAKRQPSSEGESPVWTGRTPEAQSLQNEIESAVAQAVSQLPEGQREVLILAHYEQMPLAEIAKVMDLEIGAVKSRLQRARGQLKESLAVHAPGPERRR